MAHTPTASLSPADQERRRGLRTMKSVALGALLLMAALFLVGFIGQQQVPRSRTCARQPRAAWSELSRIGSP